jgi:hypothetical protein
MKARYEKIVEKIFTDAWEVGLEKFGDGVEKTIEKEYLRGKIDALESILRDLLRPRTTKAILFEVEGIVRKAKARLEELEALK